MAMAWNRDKVKPPILWLPSVQYLNYAFWVTGIWWQQNYYRFKTADTDEYFIE